MSPSQEVFEVTTVQKQAHPSRLSLKKNDTKKVTSTNTRKKKKSEPLEQNTFSFMEDKNQRGIFDDLPNRNMYEGEDLDVPTYLRRGVQITL